MEQQPKIPTLKDAQKPQVKIKGMGAGLTLFDRLKQFKKKDLAFILAGLGTLFMAPLAEHFMMAPENGDMASGFRGAGGAGSGQNLWGTGSSPYEQGGSGIAQGGAIGGAGDIITPLNVRDPSALVMGPGAAQQPPAGSAAPATPPPTAPASTGEDYKDAIKGAASRAASAAVKKAPLPIPKIAVGGSGLRGLGAASGGNSSGSGSLGPINSGSLGQAGTGGGGLNLVRATPGFRGAAGPRGPNSMGGLDNTKKAGQNAGDAFSRTGSAMSGLNAAASEQIPTGGQGLGGGGQGGAGANDKPGGGAGAAGSKSVGESLAFIEAKERMMENLKLEFEKKKLKDPELLLYGIRNDSLKAMASEMTKSLTKGIIGMMDPSSSANAELKCDSGTRTQASLNMCDADPAKAVYPCWRALGGGFRFVSGNGGQVLDTCTPTGKGGAAGPPKTDSGGSTAPPTLNPDQSAAITGLKSTCEKINAPRPGPRTKIDEYFDNTMKPVAVNADTGKMLLEGGSPECGGTVPGEAGGKNAVELIKAAKAKLSAAAAAAGTTGGGAQGALQTLAALVPGDKTDGIAEAAKVFETVKTDELKKASDIIALAKNSSATALKPPTAADNNNGAVIDANTTAMATSVENARAAVAAEAASLETSVKALSDLADKAKAEIADSTGKGSLADTIALNAGLKKYESTPPAKAAVAAISNSSSIKADQTTTRMTLEDADKLLPLPPESDKEYTAKKEAFDAKAAAAKSSVTGIQSKQNALIKGIADTVDGTKVDALLRPAAK